MCNRPRNFPDVLDDRQNKDVDILGYWRFNGSFYDMLWQS